MQAVGKKKAKGISGFLAWATDGVDGGTVYWNKDIVGWTGQKSQLVIKSKTA